MFAPKGTGSAQVDFWEATFAKMAGSEEWTTQLATREWTPYFLRRGEFVKYLETQRSVNRAMLGEVGLLK
jgi:tripartite-type tricarboxylate transporter receptor subunit TctC